MLPVLHVYRTQRRGKPRRRGALGSSQQSFIIVSCADAIWAEVLVNAPTLSHTRPQSSVSDLCGLEAYNPNGFRMRWQRSVCLELERCWVRRPALSERRRPSSVSSMGPLSALSPPHLSMVTVTLTERRHCLLRSLLFLCPPRTLLCP